MQSKTIELCDVFFRYEQDSPWVLRGLDVTVAVGSIHALIGGNGAGKSTLLQLIAGTLKQQRGTVTNPLQQAQAFLPQNPKALFVCDTTSEELREWQDGCGYTDEAVAATVARFGLEALLEQHPYDLSGGQQQRLALAKLLLTDPQLLLLDEPTKGLDAQTKCAIARLLLELRDNGVTIVMATHDLAFVQVLSDTATMLFDGQAVCTEPASEFFADNLFYRPIVDEFVQRWDAEGER